MTENRRIFWNVVATYGRSLYSLVIGLFCGRWALMALGETDYGLNGLVGGLEAFIAFFNGILAGANARFYAFSVGAAKVAEDKTQALEECRRWFNTALSVHTVVPVVLVIVGYPIGAYAIEHWLTIPTDRIADCVWVFRFVCISCFVGMASVPFNAMYSAKQYIAELTIYGFVCSTLNVVVLYYMVTHPGVWLAKYAAWICFLSIAPQLIISIRAVCIFPECRFRMNYMWDMSRLKKLGAYSGWQILGVFCAMMRSNGMPVVINKFFGASMNAAQAIGNNLQAQCNTLAGAMQGAFTPVITQACGAKDFDKMRRFALRTCKFNVLLFAIFALPLSLEVQEVLVLWLKNPPAYTAGLCLCAILYQLVDGCTVGHMVSINSTGRVAAYQVTLSAINIFTIPIAVAIGLLWRNVYAIMGVSIVMIGLNSIGRLYFAKKEVGISVREWLIKIILPILVTLIVCASIGYLPQMFFPASFGRVCITTACCEVVLLPLTWFVLLSSEERQFMIEKFGPRLRRLLGK